MSGPSSAVPALTEALVDSNDRLLGLIELTRTSATSLVEEERVTVIAERAMDMLDLDGLGLDATPGTVRHWGLSPLRLASLDEHGLAGGQTAWECEHDLGEHGVARLRCWRSTPFDTGDQKLLDAVGHVMANALRTSRMHQSAIDQALIAREHDAAARIVNAALADPSAIGSIDGVELDVRWQPARRAGGDLWVCRVFDDVVWFAVGDVSGKGLAAAVLMSSMAAAINATIERHHTDGLAIVLGELSPWAEVALRNSGLFTTVAIGTWSPDRGLEVANAGHSPVVWVHDGHARRIDATAPPLGVMPDMVASVEHLETAPGDVLVIATDGFTEQRDGSGVGYGEDEFDATVARLSSMGQAAPIADALVEELERHARGVEQDDDRTMITMSFGAI